MNVLGSWLKPFLNRRLSLFGLIVLLIVVLAALFACGGTSGAEDPVAGARSWRSALYPEGWAPGLTDPEGRGLPDASYAGYRSGASSFEEVQGAAVVDVVADHGADPTGAADSTPADTADSRRPFERRRRVS